MMEDPFVMLAALENPLDDGVPEAGAIRAVRLLGVLSAVRSSAPLPRSLGFRLLGLRAVLRCRDDHSRYRRRR